MFSLKPLVFFDVDRISPEAIEEAMKHSNHVWIPILGNPHNAIATIAPHYPTPDELFRWTPKNS